MNLQRSDKQYIEVEQFEDYELTYCIAYEMAIRNDDFIKTIKKVILENLTNDRLITIDIIDNIYCSLDRLGITDKYPLHLEYSFYDNTTKFFIKKINDYMRKELCKGENEYDFHQKYWTDVFLSNSYEIIKNYKGYSQYVSNNFSINRIYQIKSYEDLEEEEKKHFEDIYNLIYKNIICSKWYTKEELSKIIDISLISISIKDDFEINPFLIGMFFNYKELEDKVKAFQDNEIESNFLDNIIISHPIRPKLKYKKFAYETKVVLNLALPTDELVEYIKHIKKDYDNEKLCISPLEVLGVSLEKADNLVCNDKGKKCFDPRKILSKQQKIADMFFIYDCLKEGFTQRKIQNEIYNYYANNNINNTTLDPATLRKYKDIAIDYIDNLGYKKLITGINIKN